jgi:hypothetical protein
LVTDRRPCRLWRLVPGHRAPLAPGQRNEMT